MTPNAARLLQDTVRSLRRVDIRFTGTPKLVRRPPARGLFVTDAKSVFAKLTTTDPTHEATGARAAASGGVPTPRLLARPQQVDENWHVLAFKWLREPTATREPTAAEVASLLGRIWATQAPMHCPTLDWHDLEGRVRSTIDHPEVPAALQTLLTRLLDASLATVRQHLADLPQPPRSVWTHGDLHGSNLLVVNDRLHALDWGSHSISLREHEAAKHLQGLLSQAPTVTSAGTVIPAADRAASGSEETARQFLSEMAQLGLDLTLLWRLTGLRAVDAAAHLSLPQNRGGHADWLAQAVDLAHRATHGRPDDI